MYQISFYVPTEHAQIVKNLMFDAGAGQFDNYEQCAWQTVGTGQFKPVNNASPAIGKLNKVETLEELKVEMLCAKENIEQVVNAMKHSHPYEQVAYFVLKIEAL
ncbi:hypothetical protein BPUTSESOX_1862 [uncultured Gammaproteobacteria bacterium]|jgi:hypothetical protein|uniref:NGG1p interacting factor NIF3 n=1 Tax=thiotrophic endosymbiont of Bathymodiolus puteoserpentis (Logatchev) TaxID=343240 RepID=UPI0010B0DC78|nr:NGG1p interacting factor NIF3 [thiotrophic endosymbiont of Bathymodiolus puteoserpentis (Logatchev)]CAC9483837.1 hypothetical protein [uncultured Gammaproteobacteria bacterium]CAC9585526.1 hypothetical protein [uncultured Gammaproteobacteria bacterium]CAC9643650.1 hypothetical protein [uncultured Gammaproteobacteria bacterium]CAC9652160.1 hypothetical protein [uncultured Gammaproteobacteria bacterium]CAC9989018.1 hypothetical protein [uncultured Gammaproteobacteria bacterium]